MQKYANLVELEKCCQTHISLQNFVLIQPRMSPPKICKILPILLILLTLIPLQWKHLLPERVAALVPALEVAGLHAEVLVVAPLAEAPAGSATRRPIGKISAKCCSFSVVSAPIFASKHAFFSIFQNLPDYLAEFFEIKFGKFYNIFKKKVEFS